MNDVGAIAVGRYGDLIGVTGDPLQDVARLESVRDEGRRSNQSPTD
jgi:imidazolonepropionase-like amidohydrolase